MTIDLQETSKNDGIFTDREERLKWWRGAKYGLFIHWGPGCLSGKDLSWSRGGSKPLDITNDPPGYVEDPIYDHLYKQFNPTQFDARQWVELALAAGMKYIVLTAKHHDGFSLFHTKLSEHNISNTPFKRDIVRELSDACRAAGMRFGVYYSQRDWYHRDYGIGDNKKYLAFMNGQIRELLTNYGKIDILWFDSYGHGDLMNFWGIDGTFRIIRSLQPEIIINNRMAVLADYNQQPEAYLGDHDTPEQTIGLMQTDRAWESCICLTPPAWSYVPDAQMDSVRGVVEKLVRTVTGDGNLLLNVGPMPDGRIEPRQAEVLIDVGKWLGDYGHTIFETRGGPFDNGPWGGCTVRGTKVYLHILDERLENLTLPSQQFQIGANKCLTGGNLGLTEAHDRLHLTLPRNESEAIVRIVELTISRSGDVNEKGSVAEKGTFLFS